MGFAGSSRLRVLFLSQRFLYPMDTGGKIRTGKLLEHLNRMFEITLVSNFEHPKDDKYLRQIRDLCTEFHPIPWKEIKKYSLSFYVRLALRMFSRYPVIVLNDHSRALEAKIFELLRQKQYDLLVCDFVQSSLNLQRVTGIPTLLFQHNVESVITRRHFQTARHPLMRLFWWLQWMKLNRYERSACSRFTGIVTVSDGDKKILEEQFLARNVYAIPTGVDTEYFFPHPNSLEKNSLIFTGSLDWLPNEDAILFFARDILGRIKEHIPTIRLTVVGRTQSRSLLNELRKYPEINVVGWVDDVRPYISRHALYIIPLRIGGGTRIKVFEAMAMGKAVVSTSIGVEGLPLKDGEHVILADSPHHFAQAVVELLRSSHARKRIETAGRKFVCQNFSWEKAALAFADSCRKIASVNDFEKVFQTTPSNAHSIEAQ